MKQLYWYFDIEDIDNCIQNIINKYSYSFTQKSDGNFDIQIYEK